MFVLVSCSRDEMDLSHCIFKTKKGAYDAMIDDIKNTIGNDNIDEIIAELNEDEGEYIGENSACIQAHCGTTCYSIIDTNESNIS